MNFTLHSSDSHTTQIIGFALGKVLQENKPNIVVALCGDLGAGKTHLIQGVAQGLGMNELPCSPTFSIMEEYEYLLHIDLYRLEYEDLEPLGIEEQIEQWPGLVAIEWANRFPFLLPKKHLHISISIHDNQRQLEVSCEESEPWMHQWHINTSSYL